MQQVIRVLHTSGCVEKNCLILIEKPDDFSSKPRQKMTQKIRNRARCVPQNTGETCMELKANFFPMTAGKNRRFQNFKPGHLSSHRFAPFKKSA